MTSAPNSAALTSHVISLHSYTPISLIHLYTHLTMLRTTFLRSAAPSLRATTSRQAVIVPIAVRSVSTKQPTSASAPPPPALAGQFAPGEEIDPQCTSAPVPLHLCRRDFWNGSRRRSPPVHQLTRSGRIPAIAICALCAKAHEGMVGQPVQDQLWRDGAYHTPLVIRIYVAHGSSGDMQKLTIAARGERYAQPLGTRLPARLGSQGRCRCTSRTRFQSHCPSHTQILAMLTLFGTLAYGFTLMTPDLTAVRREYPYNGLEKELGGIVPANPETAEDDDE